MRPTIRSVALAAGAVAVVAIIAAVVSSSAGNRRSALNEPTVSESETRVSKLPSSKAGSFRTVESGAGSSMDASAKPRLSLDETTQPSTSTQLAAIATSGTETVTNPSPERVHYYNGQDPNLQPRETFHIKLAGAKKLPSGYEQLGDFELTEKGWTLKPAAGGQDKPRIGMVESPPIPMKFYSNAVNPLWKEDSPSGTEVLVEVSLSEDGEKWTDWMPTTSAHYEGEMSPTYPDGRPNPNYGYTLGDMTFYGLKKFQYFRFAMTLYAEAERAPVVSDFRLFYQDSTLGDTDVAAAPTPAPEVPEAKP